MSSQQGSQAEINNKQMLVVFGDRQRPVTFNCSESTKEEYDSLVKAVKSTFEDVLYAEEGSSTTFNTGSFYLQMESHEWGSRNDRCNAIHFHS